MIYDVIELIATSTISASIFLLSCVVISKCQNPRKKLNADRIHLLCKIPVLMYVILTCCNIFEFFIK